MKRPGLEPTRFAGGGQLPMQKNWIEIQIRPFAIGRKIWIFAGSLCLDSYGSRHDGLIQSARKPGMSDAPSRPAGERLVVPATTRQGQAQTRTHEL